MPRTPRDQQSIKTRKFLSLVEIMQMAVHTGEYRDPRNPRQSDPRFREEINDIIEDIFAEELAEIRETAATELEILKREIALMRERTLRDIENRFAEHMRILEIEVRKIFQEVADGGKARKVAATIIEDIRRVPAESIRAHEQELDQGVKESVGRMNRLYQKLTGRLFNP